MNTDAYTQFKLAFLDQVAMKGYDADFIEGFFKKAEDEYNNWANLVSTVYNNDRELCKRAYVEAAFALDHEANEKQAEGGLGPELLGFLDQFGGNIGQMFGQQAGSGLGGAVVGGGGGMLIGLLLSQLFDIPLPMAMMLGALGGGALGYSAAGTQGGREGLFGVKSPGAAPASPAEPGPGLGELRRREGQGEVAAATPEPAPAPAAVNGVAQGQQVSNAAAAGAPPAPQGAVTPPTTKPVTPPIPQPGTTPAGTPPLGAPTPQPAPAAPTGATPMPTIKPPERK